MSLSRRELIRYGAVATAAATALPLAGAATASAATAPARTATTTPTTDAATIIAAYRQLQIGSGQHSPQRDAALAALDVVAEQYNNTMNVAADQLWSDLPTGPGSTYFPSMYYRLRTIAVDWATPGSALSQQAGVAERIITALSTIYRLEYNENTPEIGNWYSYEIGVPYWVLQIVVSLGDQLTQAQIAQFLAPVARFVGNPNVQTSNTTILETGANRADKSLITVVTGALLGDTARITTGLQCVTDVAANGANSLINLVTSGDGYHTDGSFIQHGTVPYPGHYGLVLLTAAAGLIAVTAGTSYELDPTVCQRFYDAVTATYAPFITSGAMMEPVRGRMLSRQGETGYDAGHQLTAAVVLLARCAPAPVNAQLAGLAASWIDAGTFAPYLDVTDVIRFAGGLQMVGVPEVEYALEMLAGKPKRPRFTPVHQSFPQSDRMVHVTRDWSASLGLSSTRICRYESINGQNLHGWYVGDGALYTFLPGDQGNYTDAYWPTIDATAIPGTTENNGTPPALGAEPTTTNTWTGGARFDEGHGAYGLDFASQSGTLTAKKAWFFTPDAVICLGAGITDTSGATTRTIVENRNLGENGTTALLVNGQPGPTTIGTTTVLQGARWLHLDGVAGYVLLQDAPVSLLREDRTGTWFGIDTGANTHGTTDPYTRRFQQIQLGHGVNPTGATYAYAVLPGASPWQTVAATGRWRVLSNTAQLQAVSIADEKVAAVFWAAGSVDGVAVSAPAAVQWGWQPGGLRFAVSDPTQAQTTIQLTLSGIGRRVVQADPGVTVVSTGRQLVIDVAVAGTLGATHTFTVR
ncbi:MAG TPA: polysaccharide lyase 8 family protein [Pseudonocardiaceae bacterium]|nr:polysaccharide lyase 8 family protein [Pseudonocardiaceae bacterium]